MSRLFRRPSARGWRHLWLVAGLLAVSELAGQIVEPTSRVRADRTTDWRLGLREGRENAALDFPVEPYTSDDRPATASIWHRRLGTVSPSTGLPRAIPEEDRPVSRQAMRWMTHALVPPERRRELAARFRELVPDFATLPSAAGPPEGSTTWVRIVPSVILIRSSFSTGRQNETFEGPRDCWTIPATGKRTVEAKLVMLTPGAIEMSFWARSPDYLLRLQGIDSVWHDAATDRIVVVDATDGRRLVIHLPSRVLLLDTGPTK